MKIFKYILIYYLISLPFVYVFYKNVQSQRAEQEFAVFEQAPSESPQMPEINTANLARSWRLVDTFQLDFTDKARTLDQQHFDEALGAGMHSSNGIWYHFYADGQAAEEWLGMYRPGKWTLNPADSTILFKLDEDPKGGIVLKIRFLDISSMGLQMSEGAIKGGFILDVAEIHPANPEEDPFHPLNNKWRQKARKSETEAQIKARIHNHLEHYVKLLQVMEKSQKQDLSFKRSPSCLKIYSSAVGLRRDKDIPEDWFQIFHSMKNAEKGKEMLERAIATKYNHGATEGSWIKDDIKIIRHFQQVL